MRNTLLAACLMGKLILFRASVASRKGGTLKRSEAMFFDRTSEQGLDSGLAGLGNSLLLCLGNPQVLLVLLCLSFFRPMVESRV